MANLRQKTYAIFIRPYITYTDEAQNSNKLIQRGNLYVKAPGQNNNTYSNVESGECWMLYKGKYINSYSLLIETVKEIMDTLGYSINDIRTVEIIPTNHIITPIS